METKRTPAQQKAYDRWLASNEPNEDKEWARFYNKLVEKYKHLPDKARRIAMESALKRRRNKGINPHRASFVSGGSPGLGKR